MARPFFSRVADLRRSGERLALATVVRTNGSTPQGVGARMVVVDRPDDVSARAAGTLGGGCVEADAILAAREVLTSGARSLRAYELTEDLAWNTGLVCGGTMWILVEPDEQALSASNQPMLDDLVHAAEGGAPLAIVTRLRREGRQVAYAGRVFVEPDGLITGSFGNDAVDEAARHAAVRQLEHGTPAVVSLDEHHDLLIEPVTGRPALYIAGGGHVARAIARQAMLLDFDVTVIEDRPEFSDPARFEGARVVQGDMAETLASQDYGWSTYVVIATRGHKLDADCVLSAARTPARYIGVLGSRRKTILINEMLREAGIPEDRIAAIRSPVGLDLGGRSPAEIALAVMAEITQARYQGSGRPLRDR